MSPQAARERAIRPLRPGEPDRLALGISAAGVWLTDDGGATWRRGNEGIVARYLPEDPSGDPTAEVDILARIDKNLRDAPLAGFVAEGSAPFASMSNAVEAALKRATLSGMPVVKVGRGNAEGIVDPARAPLAIAGSPRRVREQIQKHIDLGCTMFVMEFFGRDTKEAGKLFAETVLPHFK